ncbi:hypothetical protein ACFL5Q_07360 [Planctomycetota bacterium]
MATNRQRAKPGDLLEVKSSRGLSYVQYVGKHPEYGDVILVLPGCFKGRPSDLTCLVDEAAGFLAFYSARAAVLQDLAEIVASHNLPSEIEVPTKLRRAGARGPGGEVRTWIIENEDHEIVREKLSDLEKQLPIAAIWDHELLTRRISEGWRPENQG